MRERLPLPQRIQNAPELFLGLEIYFSAWLDLHSCRPVAWAEQPIRWIDINDYADRLELSPEQREDMHHHVREMDNAYLKWKESKRPKDGKSG
jgi:hypothetical protein